MSVLQDIVAGLGAPNFSVLIPEIIILITALIVFFIELFTKARLVISIVTAIGLLLAGIATLTMEHGDITFYGLYAVDSFSLTFKFFLILTTFFVVIVLRPYLESKRTYYGEYYYLILFALLGMMIMVSANNLVTMYIGLELASVTIYILAGMFRKDYLSKEGAFKYLIIGGTGTAILSYGIAVIYGRTGSFDFAQIADAITSNNLDVAALAGIALILIGLGLKASTVPFHFWTPDAYQGAPTPITAFMGVAAKIATFAVILRVMVQAFPFASEAWTLGWALLAAASMIFGNFVALRQDNVKRMLAYSSVAHAGYILAALAAPTGMAFTALIFYSLVYIFMGLGGFIFLSAMERQHGWTNNINDFRGLAKRSPMMALFMLIFMFSMLGIPPTVGFFGKLGVFLALIGSDIWWLAIVLVVMSIVSAGYYLRVVVYMYMHEPQSAARFNFSLGEMFTIAFMATFILILGIYPTVFWGLSTLLSDLLIQGIGR
ncbi:NADH-quinone oxidoreductase subunit N [Persephonella sp.]|uniref:NADH-quinone oxidoreductase subunit N n=1 Tax=Persephonella sp. TaxID=2060922 RepID=UPI002632E40B|nr:NADH-quinone oxidoreductase subunit N [Persephonella sp.]